MKKLFFFLITFFAVNLLFAQTENYKIAINKFQASYNDEKYDEIFNSFSKEMQQVLPLAKTKQFLIGLKMQAGKIESKEFIEYQQGSYATFKTKFEKAILAINISLDDQNKINGLFVKPYEELNENETKAVNALTNYPKKLSQIIFSQLKNLPNTAQLSIGIIENGATNYYSIIKENDSIKSIHNQTKVFEIGSISKVFTSAILASLVEENKLKLTDYINSYYPFTFKNNVQICFESLANHSSGLPRLPDNLNPKNPMNPYKDYGKRELEAYLTDSLNLESKPQTTYVYSNLGAGLLGYTLGLSQKTSFQNLLQKKIFDTYKMRNSFTSSQNLKDKLIKGLNKNGEVVSNWDFDVLFGAGGVLSTTEDLATFAKAQFNTEDKVLALTRKPTVTVNDKMKIGLGWHILKSDNDKEIFWHNGGTGGYSSSMAISVDKKTAVIILSNVSGINDKVDALCFKLINETIKK